MPATGFSDLDTLLEELTAGLEETLGEDLVGLYLQGSSPSPSANEPWR